MAVAAPCLQFPHSPTTMSPKKSNDAVLLYRSTFLGTTSSSSKINRTRSFEFKPKQRPSSLPTIRRACSANFDTSSDEEFSRKLQKLAIRFQISDENSVENFTESQTNLNLTDDDEEENSLVESSLMEIQNVEMKAKSLDLPLSLRMIKQKKKQLQDNFTEAGESTYCSVKKAFSSMVFIIRELHSYTLQMREILYFEDLQGILARVQSEMHASFVWLFQQVFSHTPTLMVYVMILLANFTVYSMSTSAAIAVTPPVATVEVRDFSSGSHFEFDSSTVKIFTVSSSGSNTAAVGGNYGGGNNGRLVGSGMDGDSWMNNNSGIVHRPIVPDGVSPVSTREDTRQKEEVEEVEIWNSIVDEATRMQGQVRDESLDDEAMQSFVSPVTAKIEADDYVDYFKTELHYQSCVAQEPNNVLLLANYAQFLYLVVHDFDRYNFIL